MWSEQDPVCAPLRLKEVAGTLSPSFQGNDQQDSQEFLAFLLDILHVLLYIYLFRKI